jgi:hypothetical protein
VKNTPEKLRMIPRSKGFPLHAKVFSGVFTLSVICNLIFDFGVPVFWPLAVWSIALAFHFFIASAGEVPEDWVESRAEELRYKSYDYDHIRDIRQRVEERDVTVTHHAEREKSPYQ